MTADARQQDDGAKKNTDRELWREREGDYYADSIHVTQSGAIGINHGGLVIVAPLAQWHAALVRAGGVPQPDRKEVMPSEPDKLHLQHDSRSSSVPDPQRGASAVAGEQHPVTNTARAGGVERTPEHKDYGIYSPETERELSTVYTGHLGDEKYPTDVARGAVEPPAQEPENLPDALLLELWRAVSGPHAQLTGPLIRFAGKVLRSARPSPPPATPQESQT